MIVILTLTKEDTVPGLPPKYVCTSDYREICGEGWERQDVINYVHGASMNAISLRETPPMELKFILIDKCIYSGENYKG